MMETLQGDPLLAIPVLATPESATAGLAAHRNDLYGLQHLFALAGVRARAAGSFFSLRGQKQLGKLLDAFC
jgi:hypothetical protein